MQKKLKLAVIALCCTPAAFAQKDSTATGDASIEAFTFTEAQLGEDDDMSQNVTIVNANNNVYASQVGYLFSPVRFRYRAFNQKYNEIYINGAEMNDMESGQFRYSMVGGLNQQTKGVEYSLPFENNLFSVSAMGGSNNYNFRPARQAAGHRITLSAANRNYILRGAYNYASGLTDKGWAFAGSITCRWANEGYVEGTFYNSLSYYLGIQKVINDKHSLSLMTWGNPTKRASQGAATDESYWIANNRQYNPYWGYQNGKKRNSRVVNDFAPTALMTWDFDISDEMKLTTSLYGKYTKYKSTKLNYNNSENPQPDYWKNLPSSYYDVWDKDDKLNRTAQGLTDWNTAYNFLTSSKENRQINWDRLYWSNQTASAQGSDALYYVQAKNNNHLTLGLSSSLKMDLNKNTLFNIGIQMRTNKGMHYQTMEDLLGATSFHNYNTYAMSSYSLAQDGAYYDLNNRNQTIGKGDRFGYDYNIFVNKAGAWTSLQYNKGKLHSFVAAKVNGVSMQREGKMRNGMFAENSYGKSGTAHFLEGGGKFGGSYNLSGGHAVSLGAGYEWKAPQASTAFVSPEQNNDFVADLKNERVFSSELGYQFQNNWLHANISGYYSHIDNATEWQQFYFDDINSFSYVSLTGIKKAYYGVEWGLNFKVNSAFNIKAIGTVSEAKNLNNSKVWYMSSTSSKFNEANNGNKELCLNKNMREAGTPLTALSLILSYHNHGWYLDLNGNYYDRIYLYYSPSYRYESTLKTRQSVSNNVYNSDGTINPDAVAQAKGKGGFMLDASIGKSIYLKHGSLSINLMITNVLNNRSICTGGYEQSRSEYTSSGNVRAYKFSNNPKKYYAYGTNGMLNIAYKF